MKLTSNEMKLLSQLAQKINHDTLEKARAIAGELSTGRQSNKTLACLVYPWIEQVINDHLCLTDRALR